MINKIRENYIVIVFSATLGAILSQLAGNKYLTDMINHTFLGNVHNVYLNWLAYIGLYIIIWGIFGVIIALIMLSLLGLFLPKK